MDDVLNLSATPQRHLPLEGSYNIRDIGGYKTIDGHSIRWRTVLRADNLSNLSESSQRTLLEYPVRTVIDLRRTKEVHKAPALFAHSSQVKYINISLLEDEQKILQVDSITALYRLILETYQQEVRSVIEILAQKETFPCVVHCAIGKDRTGLIIALLLSVGNVPASVIAWDYALSEQYLDPLFKLLRARAEQAGKDLQRLEWLVEARQETMLETLAYLDSHYGGVRGYLTAIGITGEQIENLHAMLVEV